MIPSRWVKWSFLISALLTLAPVRAFELSLDTYPAFPPTAELQRLASLYESVRQHQRDRDYEAAAAAMEELVDAGWPFEIDVLSFKLGLARIYQRAQMGDKAEALLANLETSTTARHPLYPDIYYQLSSAILEGGDRERGLERFRYLADAFSGSDAGQLALQVLARAYRDDGDPATAWQYYDRFLVTYLGRKARHATLLEAAEMFFETGEVPRAESMALLVWSEINRYPDSGPRGLGLVRTFKRHNLTDAALAVARDLCGSDKTQAQEGCFLAAQLLEEAGDAAAAADLYRTVLAGYPLTRLSVRAYTALGKQFPDEQPVVPEPLLGDRDNEHWPALMTEMARLAERQGRPADVVAALEDVPPGDDRLSQQRARMFLQACVALAGSDGAHGCAWLTRAVEVRPYVSDHEKAVRTWLADCAREFRGAELVRFADLPSADGRIAVTVLDELIKGWGTAHPGMQDLLFVVWNLDLRPRDRLDLAPLVIGSSLRGETERWRDDLARAEFALWDEVKERGFDQTAYVGVIDALVEHGKRDEAVDWLLAFAEHAAGPGMERTRGLLDHLVAGKDTARFDAVLAAYLAWYPDASDLADYAAKQVELRISGPDLREAWAVVEGWLARMNRDEARRFLKLIQPRFAARGSPFVEPLNAYILQQADSAEDLIEAHRQLGDHYLKMMDFNKAAIHLEQAFGLSVDLPDRDKVKIGTSLLKAALEAGYDETYVNYLLAGIRRIMDTVTDPAVRAQAGNQLGKMLQDLGLHEEAYRMLREAADSDTRNMSAKAALYNLAKTYAENGQDELSLATYLEYLAKYRDESDQRFYNIALANALSVAMKGADPAVIGELQAKSEALINGVSDPYTLLDLAQYFGRQGHAGIQEMLLEKGLDEARKVIDTAATPEEQHKALEAAIKRLFKMGYYVESTALGEQHYQEALANNPATQSERLHFAQYEMLRAKLGSAYGMGRVVSEQAAALYEVAKANNYHDAAVKYLMLMASESPSREARFSAKEELVSSYPDSQPAFRAKVDLAGKAYAEGDKEKARTIALDALAQASGDYQKDFAENIRFNVLYINAVLLDEAGRGDLSAPMWQEIENYEFKDSWIYVDEIMKGEPSGYY